MLQSIFDIYSYAPKWVKWCLYTLILICSLFFLRPYISDLVYLSNSHISTNEPTIIDKARALKEYIRYTYRTAMYDGPGSESSPLVRNRAIILGLDDKGVLHIEVYTLKGKVKAQGHIADVQIHDLSLALKIITEEAPHAVVVDTYKHEDKMFFVVWLKDGTPLNEGLILGSAGGPIKSPPTNIVNRLFKNHYKKIAFEN